LVAVVAMGRRGEGFILIYELVCPELRGWHRALCGGMGRWRTEPGEIEIMKKRK
jgi:hypothetical protein